MGNGLRILRFFCRAFDSEALVLIHFLHALHTPL
jgi:hypothetical protein